MNKPTIGHFIRNLMRKSAGFAAAGALATGASVTAHAEVVEKPALHRFHYEYVNVGPREHEREDYVRIRDAAEEALRGPNRDLGRYFDLKRQLDQFVLETKWIDDHYNLVTTVGGNDALTNEFKGSSYTAAWYVLLVDNASFSAYNAADTSASHAGWLESAAYSNSTRPALTLGTAASKSIDNSASKASFTINTTATIRGAGVISNSTKSGTTGVLYSAGDFTGGNRAVANGDTLQIQVTLSI